VTKKIAYLGPPGTFCEMAVQKYFNQGAARNLVSYPSIPAVFAAVCSGEVDLGVVPIENSYEGTVTQTLDLLAYEYDLTIFGEIILPVQQNLLALKGVAVAEVAAILSHPQALAQCRKYLEEFLLAAKLVEVSSTAEAARRVADSGKPWAAIGPSGAAQAYGLEILTPNINDHPNNETRFLLLSKEESSCSEDCKTSLLINVLNKPGALLQALKEFSLRGINLTKLESRPAKTRIGEYLFFIDLDGHFQEPKIADALTEINKFAQPIKVLGSYPAASGITGRKSIFNPNLDYLRQEVDIIDEQIIELLGRRTRLVERIGDFKANAQVVHDPNREQWILEKLSHLAVEKGFSPQVTVEIYQILFQHFVNLQKVKK
jgi:prephenate dehydratase